MKFLRTNLLKGLSVFSISSVLLFVSLGQSVEAGVQQLAQSRYNNSFAFTGRRYQASTGLYQFPNRSYDPALGRWLQRDPIGTDDGMNTYAYVGGRVSSFVDPTGLSGEDSGGGSFIGGVGSFLWDVVSAPTRLGYAIGEPLWDGDPGRLVENTKSAYNSSVDYWAEEISREGNVASALKAQPTRLIGRAVLGIDKDGNPLTPHERGRASAELAAAAIGGAKTAEEFLLPSRAGLAATRTACREAVDDENSLFHSTPRKNAADLERDGLQAEIGRPTLKDKPLDIEGTDLVTFEVRLPPGSKWVERHGPGSNNFQLTSEAPRPLGIANPFKNVDGDIGVIPPEFLRRIN